MSCTHHQFLQQQSKMVALHGYLQKKIKWTILEIESMRLLFCQSWSQVLLAIVVKYCIVWPGNGVTWYCVTSLDWYSWVMLFVQWYVRPYKCHVMMQYGMVLQLGCVLSIVTSNPIANVIFRLPRSQPILATINSRHHQHHHHHHHQHHLTPS